MPKLILVRHGESEWNQENRFTGWYDSDLSAKGCTEAQRAGQLLAEHQLYFDRVHTSLLKRAIRTLWNIQDQTDRMWVPVTRHWRLNERHYGALQGLNKAETAAKHGEQQVLIWRRSFDTPPPALERSDQRHPCNDKRYRHLDGRVLPNSESLKDTIARVLPYWHDAIVGDLRQGHCVLVVAHGNSLRALVKYLDNLDNEAIMQLNIPTGVPLVYELDDQLRTLSQGYLGDAQEIAQRQAAVANQGKSNG